MMHGLNPFQLIVVPILSVLGLYSLIEMMRGTRWRMAGLRAILWFAAAAAVFRPQITIAIARALGIGRGTDLVMYLFIIGSLGAALYFYAQIVRLESAITTLVRHAALHDKPEAKT